MKIALISYEYPPDTAHGGIATYVEQAAKMLALRNHSVEVFAGSPHRTETYTENGVVVHRFVSGRDEFRFVVGPRFAERHALVGFDVLEGPEYKADASDAVHRVSDIPLVIKLHTPSYMINCMNRSAATPIKRLRARIGDIKRVMFPGKHSKEYDSEYLQILDADEIASPSRSLGWHLKKSWSLDPALLSHLPYPYAPSHHLLRIPADTLTGRITFLGRLEIRKGVLDIASAIPLVIRKHPNAKFRFVGRSLPSPEVGKGMREYLQKKLHSYSEAVEFFDPVPLEAVPTMLEDTDICVFPSLWENFPNVCLEAMSAARAVIGSHEGGMADMLDGNKFGRLVPPRSPAAIAREINLLLSDPTQRQNLGQVARDRVLSEYGIGRIGALQEECYNRAIARRRALGPRKPKTA